jgi:hypothetical protein
MRAVCSEKPLDEFHCYTCLALRAEYRCVANAHEFPSGRAIATNSMATRSKVTVPPAIQPTMKEWFGPAVQQIVKSR